MNLGKISNRSLLGKLLRLPLRFIPPQTQIKILRGPAKGLKWVVGTSNHGVWLGSYEYEKERKFAACLSLGSVVFDMGAHAGFYTILAAKHVGRTGHVYAFEPFAQNCANVRRHVVINDLPNVTIVEAAVADFEGTAKFAENINTATGTLSCSGGVEVKLISLDGFIRGLPEEHQTPAVMKIDVEGAEVRVLKGAENLLRRVHPRLLLATHSVALHGECRRLLEAIGYRVQELETPGANGLGELFAEADSQVETSFFDKQRLRTLK